MTDEEKKAIERIEMLVEYLKKWNKNFTVVPEDAKYFEKILDMTKTHLRMIDENIEEILQQSKEIEELSDKLTEKICKGVEEKILEEYRQTIISKDKEIEELKEDKYGLEEEVQMQAKNIMLYENALCEIQDKIKAKIEEVKDGTYDAKIVLQSLLEKE